MVEKHKSRASRGAYMNPWGPLRHWLVLVRWHSPQRRTRALVADFPRPVGSMGTLLARFLGASALGGKEEAAAGSSGEDEGIEGGGLHTR